MLDTRTGYDIAFQVKFVMALAVVHNFLVLERSNEDRIAEEYDREIADRVRQGLDEDEEDEEEYDGPGLPNMEKHRERIAQAMWLEYSA